MMAQVTADDYGLSTAWPHAATTEPLDEHACPSLRTETRGSPGAYHELARPRNVEWVAPPKVPQPPRGAATAEARPAQWQALVGAVAIVKGCKIQFLLAAEGDHNTVP